jgi:hypothetical protein
MKALPPLDNLLIAAVESGLKPQEPTMADIFHLQPRDQWQFTAEVIKKPDGKLVAVLVDARGSIVDGEGSPSEKLNSIAKMLEESVAGMRATAQAVKD